MRGLNRNPAISVPRQGHEACVPREERLPRARAVLALLWGHHPHPGRWNGLGQRLSPVPLLADTQHAGKAIRKIYICVCNCNIYSSLLALNLLFLGTE